MENTSLAEAYELQGVTAAERNHAVRLLLKIFVIGPFRQETFFSAVGIMDRYLELVCQDTLEQF